jgi:hypothetical protein
MLQGTGLLFADVHPGTNGNHKNPNVVRSFFTGMD